jgi:hypothetical protein
MPNLFDRARFIGTPSEGLALETRRRNRIGNAVGLEAVSYGQEKKFWAMVTALRWIARRPPTGVYNCAGHVWAARRTGIFEPSAWEMILTDDGYRALEEGDEAVRQGDLVLYRLVDTNEIFHVGEVIEIRRLEGLGGKSVPWILSKLDATSGEVLHAVEQVPYKEQGLPFRIEFWTDRPREKRSTQ